MGIAIIQNNPFVEVYRWIYVRKLCVTAQLARHFQKILT